MEQKAFLQQALHEFHISLRDEQLDQLLTFYELLVEKNKVMNLTAITEFEEVVFKHFLDSLAICKVAFDQGISPFQTEEANSSQTGKKVRLIDVGCGAGFPGMVIAIAYSGVQVTLLDSLQKRVGFLQEVIEKLAIANCSAVHFRAEEAARMKEYRDSFDYVVSRAVANLSTLSEYCLPYVKPGGYFIAYKSEKIRQEAPAAQKAIKLLGGKFASETEFYLPEGFDQGSSYRNLYVIQKTGPTPAKYPRKAPLPAKQPL